MKTCIRIVAVAPIMLGLFAFCAFAVLNLPSLLGVVRSAGYQSQIPLLVGILFAFTLTVLIVAPHPSSRPAQGMKERAMQLLGVLMFAWITPAVGWPVFGYWFSSSAPNKVATVNEYDFTPGRRSRCSDVEMTVAEDRGLFSTICVSEAFAKSHSIGTGVLLEGRELAGTIFYVEGLKSSQF